MNTQQYLKDYIESLRESEFEKGKLHFSDLNHLCVSRVFQRVNGYDASPPTEEQLRIYERGRVWEDKLREIITRGLRLEAKESGAKRKYIKQEKEVQGPFGAVGHMDIYIPRDQHIIECKTTTTRGERFLPYDGHLRQAQAYLMFEDDAETAEVQYILTETFETPSYRVQVTPEIEDFIHDFFRRASKGIKSGDGFEERIRESPNGYPCSWESKDVQFRCPYLENCFEEFEEEEPSEVERNELIDEYLRLKDEYRQSNRRLKALKKKKKKLEGKLDPLFDQEGDVLKAGDIQLKRVHQEGESFSFKKAVAAGAISRDQVEEFINTYGYNRYYVKQISE